MTTVSEQRVQKAVEAIKASADPNYLGMWRHPLYVGFPLPEVPNAAPLELHEAFNLKRLVKRKLEGVDRAMRRQDYWAVVMMWTERPFRLEKFWQLVADGHLLFHTSSYNHLLADVWVDCESPHVNRDIWVAAFLGADRYGTLTMEEREARKALPTTLTVYRGTTKDEASGTDPWRDAQYGLSWTLSRKTAEWFARRWSTHRESEPAVLESTIERHRVFGPFDGRGEAEIVVPYAKYLSPVAVDILEDPSCQTE